jgi:hypothetical protein
VVSREYVRRAILHVGKVGFCTLAMHPLANIEAHYKRGGARHRIANRGLTEKIIYLRLRGKSPSNGTLDGFLFNADPRKRSGRYMLEREQVSNQPIGPSDIGS